MWSLTTEKVAVRYIKAEEPKEVKTHELATLWENYQDGERVSETTPMTCGKEGSNGEVHVAHPK